MIRYSDDRCTLRKKSKATTSCPDILLELRKLIGKLALINKQSIFTNPAEYNLTIYFFYASLAKRKTKTLAKHI